jgi:hypothetical protein
MLSLRLLIALTLLSLSQFSGAHEVLTYLIESEYLGPSVEDNIILMDTDKNGFADVFEVRAYLEKIHGKDYQKELLDKWEASASGKSCSTPFAKQLYLK